MVRRPDLEQFLSNVGQEPVKAPEGLPSIREGMGILHLDDPQSTLEAIIAASMINQRPIVVRFNQADGMVTPMPITPATEPARDSELPITVQQKPRLSLLKRLLRR